VLDLTVVVSGPMAAMVLADQGADVIKIEMKGGLDSARIMGKQPRADIFTESSQHTMMGRGKRSLVVNLKTAQGKELFFDLVKGADVVMSNFRPGAMDKLGLSYADCQRVKPDIIYVTVAGFGTVGPFSGKPIYDPIIQGAAGVTAGQMADGKPTLVQSLICDKTTSQTTAQAITAALFAKAQGRGGQHVQVSMHDVMLQYQWPEVFWNFTLADAPGPDMPDFHNIYRLGNCSDGQITLIFVQDKDFFGICRAVGHPEWIEDPRFSNPTVRGQNMTTVIPMLEGALAKLTVAEALSRLEAEDVPCGPVLSKQEVLTHPQTVATKSIVTAKHPEFGKLVMPRPAALFSSTPSWFTADDAPFAPRLGQHSAQVLREDLGFSAEKINALVKAGVIMDAGPASKL